MIALPKIEETAEDIRFRQGVEAGIKDMQEGRFCTLEQLDEKVSARFAKAEKKLISQKNAKL